MSYSPSYGSLTLKLDGAVTPPSPPPGDGGTQTPKTLTVFFWDSENFFQSPAKRVMKLAFKNLISATLTINVTFGGLWWGGVKFNGAEVSNSTQDTADVTGKIKLGSNEVKMEFATLLGNIGISTGNASVYIEMLMNITDQELEDLINQNEADNTPSGFDLKTIAIIAGIGVAAVGGIVLITSLKKSPTERAIEQMTQLEVMRSLRRKS